MDKLDNIFKIATEAVKLSLIEFDKDLIEEFSPHLDYVSIAISKDDFSNISTALKELARPIYQVDTETEVHLYSLDRPLLCTPDQLLPKISFTFTKTKSPQVSYVGFVTEPLTALHTYLNKHKYNPASIEIHEDGNKQFFVEINGNKVAFSKTSFAQAEEILSLRTKLNSEMETKLRLLADFQNYRKRTEQTIRESGDMANKVVLNQIIEVIDDCRRAKENEDHDGLQILIDKLKAVLFEQGLVEIEVRQGDKFDPQTMEAISSIPVGENQEPNTIVHIEQTGYKYNASGKIYKSTRVIVTK